MARDGRRSTSHRSGEDGHRSDLHQALLREVNERIEQLNAGWDSHGADGILCECGDRGCMETIEVTAAVYERVRRDPTRFLVKVGHGRAGRERIVEQTDGYLVVEKVGEAAETASQLDPRQRSRKKDQPPQ
jgi:hypothetical protein